MARYWSGTSISAFMAKYAWRLLVTAGEVTAWKSTNWKLDGTRMKHMMRHAG